MGIARKPFELIDVPTTPPLPISPRISDEIQQSIATLVGYDGNARRLLKVTSTGMLQVVNPLSLKFQNILANIPNYVWQGTNVKCSEVVVRGHPDNGGRIWVNVFAAAAADVGWPLDSNEYITLTLTNLSYLHLKIITNTEKAIIYYMQ